MKKLPVGFTRINFLRNLRGFTLIELLIVMAIIGILAVLGTYGYTVALKITRDAKRQADLKVIQTALEQFHADQHYYPPLLIDFTAGMEFSDATGMPAGTVKTKVYLNNVPADPIFTSSSQRYQYQPIRSQAGGPCGPPPAPNCQFYCLYAVMEMGISQTNLCVPHKPGYTLEVTPP